MLLFGGGGGGARTFYYLLPPTPVTMILALVLVLLMGDLVEVGSAAFVIPDAASPSSLSPFRPGRRRIHDLSIERILLSGPPHTRLGLALRSKPGVCRTTTKSSTSSSLQAEKTKRQQGGGGVLRDRERGKKQQPEYIDDCFGLVALSSVIVAHDVIFGATFVALSAVALVATRANLVNQWLLEKDVVLTAERQRRAVPGVVAVTALLVAPVVEQTVRLWVAPFFETSISMLPELEGNARLLELAVCSVSFLYGFFSKVDDEEQKVR